MNIRLCLHPLTTLPVQLDAQRQGSLNTSSPNSDQPPAPSSPPDGLPTLPPYRTSIQLGEYQSSSLSNVLIQPINRFCQLHLLSKWGIRSLCPASVLTTQVQTPTSLTWKMVTASSLSLGHPSGLSLKCSEHNGPNDLSKIQT